MREHTLSKAHAPAVCARALERTFEKPLTMSGGPCVDHRANKAGSTFKSMLHRQT